MKKPVVAFCPCDDNNLPHFVKLQNSLRKFHSEEELPLIKYDLKEVPDPMKWYFATPLIAKELLNEYECVIKMDADMVITGDISQVWTGDFDLSVVQNSNPREFQSFPYQFLKIDPLTYVNNGLVGIKNQELVEHWWKLCQTPGVFNAFQMREQDILNLLILMNYKVKYLDASDQWYGLVSKGYWPQIELQDDKLILPKNEEWPVDNDKQIVCLHWAGGNDPTKANYKVRFKEEVTKWLDKLVS